MSSGEDENRLEGLEQDVEALHAPDSELYPSAKVAFVASLAKAHYTPAIPTIASLLRHEDSSLRSEALKALLRYFKLPEYWEAAQRFMLEDPDPGCRILGATLLGNIEEDTRDSRTLATLASVVRDEMQDPLLRGQAYSAMRDVLKYDAREQWNLTAKSIDEIADVDWAWVDSCLQDGEAPKPR